MPPQPPDPPAPSGGCGQDLGQSCTAIWTEQSSYGPDDPVNICVTVPQPSYIVITEYAASGPGSQIESMPDNGDGMCFQGPSPGSPPGRRLLVLSVYDDASEGDLLGQAVALFSVIDAPTDTPVPPTATPIPPTATPAPTSTPPPPTSTPAPPTPTGTPSAAAATATPTSRPPSAPSPTASPRPTGTAAVSISVPPPTPRPTRHASTATHRPRKRTHHTTARRHRQRARRAAAPALHVALLGGMVSPGATQRVAISYVGRSLVEAGVRFPGLAPLSLVEQTDRHGRLVLALRVPPHVALRHGRAQATLSVHAVLGRWRRLASLTATVHPRRILRIGVAFTPGIYLRAVVTFAGGAASRRPLSLYGLTGADHHATLLTRVPATIASRHGRAIARVTLWTLQVAHRARATRILRISDMLVGIVPGRISRCAQVLTVRVRYHAGVPLRVMLRFPNGYRLPLTLHTNRQGIALQPVSVRYVKARSPVVIYLRAADARPKTDRSEQAVVTITLPKTCTA